MAALGHVAQTPAVAASELPIDTSEPTAEELATALLRADAVQTAQVHRLRNGKAWRQAAIRDIEQAGTNPNKRTRRATGASMVHIRLDSVLDQFGPAPLVAASQGARFLGFGVGYLRDPRVNGT